MLPSAKAKAKAKGVTVELNNISNQELTLRLEKLVHSERKLTHTILVHILEIESRRLYAELGFDSMFSYLTKGLGYSESAAYRRLQTARLLKFVPAVAKKLEQGSLNLSQLTQVQKCLKVKNLSSEKLGTDVGHPSRENYLEVILAKIENKNTFETKKILATEFDQPIQLQTVLTPQKDESVRIELTFTKEQFEVLQQAKNFLSHTIHNNSLADVIEHLALKFNKGVLGKSNSKNIDIEQVSDVYKNSAERSQIVNAAASHIESESDSRKNELSILAQPMAMTHGFAATQVKRRKLSIKLKRALMTEANYSCQYIDTATGRKCDSKYQLQVDHVQPVAKDGSDRKNNLQILCRTHNHFKGVD